MTHFINIYIREFRDHY